MSFVNKPLTDILDCVRASTATYVDPTGRIRTAGANQPRIDFSSGQGRLLNEEARTNLLTWSEDFSNAAWSKANVTVAASASLSPDGQNTAYKLVSSEGNSWQRLGRFLSVLPNTAYTQSWYVKSDGVRYCSTYFRSSEFGVANNSNTLVVDLETGDFVSGNNIKPSVVRLANGWFRISISGTTISNPSSNYVVITLAGSLNLVNDPLITGDGTSGIYIWGAQLEQG